MNRLNFKLFIVLLLWSLTIKGQSLENKDCSTALDLCGVSPFQLISTEGVGMQDTILQNSCLASEYNSLWIKINIQSEGYLTFKFTPNNPTVDLDFAVFRSALSNCENNELIRCMASGINIGNPDSTQLDRCLGATGLRENEIDFEETSGCQAADNNFLAPIDCQLGEVYYIILNDFSYALDTTMLEFGGTAEINCITTNISESNFKPEQISLFPNPSVGPINYHIPEQYVGGSLRLIDLQGNTVHFIEKLVSRSGNLLLSQLENGMYSIVISNKNSSIAERFQIFHHN